MNDQARKTLSLAKSEATAPAKSRVSNEQLLAAMVAGNAAIVSALQNLTTILSAPAQPFLQPSAGTVQIGDRVEAPKASVRETRTYGDGTCGALPILTKYPEKFNSEAAAYVIKKAGVWRQAQGLTDGSVTVVIQRAAYGKLSCRFFRNETKAPTNAVGAIARV